MSWYGHSATFVIRQWKTIAYIVLLVIAFSFFTFFQATPELADPDSFYHVKSAMLIPQEGIITQFPWLQFTVLKDSYIDQHFLYHVFLQPFTRLFDPIGGAKLATILLATGMTLLFYWLLRSQRIKFAFIYTLLLLGSMPFIFRINLIKAPVLSIIILLVGLYCLFKHKPLALLLVSFFYVWAYGGFILIVIFSGLYAVVSIAEHWWYSRGRRSFATVVGHSVELKLFIASLVGVVTGIVINPYFPYNLEFYGNQLIKIGIINYQSIISVGNEWYPYEFIDLTAHAAFVSMLLLAVLFVFIFKYRRPTRKTIFLFLVSVVFFLFTLKSRRYVEYYVPFTLLFCAFALGQYLHGISWEAIRSGIKKFFRKYTILAVILAVYCLVVPSIIIIKEAKGTYRDLRGIPVNRFEGAATWLKENSNPGEIVFHSSWDEFPMLFYFNSHNYYINGLDPTFSYEYDTDLYSKVVAITLGRQKENVYIDLKDTFGASYVFIESSHRAMEQVIKDDAGFQEVYRDTEAAIYKVL